MPLTIEIGRIEPALECRTQHWPLAVEHGEPCRIAILSLDDHMLAEQPFMTESEARGRPPGAEIVIVAFPFEAAIAEIVEDMAGEQIKRLRRAGGPGGDRRDEPG